MNLEWMAFPLFLLVIPPVALEMLGFGWKSTELYIYYMGFCLGIAFVWGLP